MNGHYLLKSLDPSTRKGKNKTRDTEIFEGDEKDDEEKEENYRHV